jgi:hypothetical protein
VCDVSSFPWPPSRGTRTELTIGWAGAFAAGLSFWAAVIYQITTAI